MEKQQQYEFLKQPLDITKENYRQYNAINYSLLSAFSERPENYTMDFNNEGPMMVLGSIVDSLIFDNKYPDNIIIDFDNKPTGQMFEFCTKLSEIGNLEEESMLEAYNYTGFKRDTIEKVKERFNLEGLDYYQFLINSKGKKIVNPEMIAAATMCLNKWGTSQNIREILTSGEVYTQVPIVFKVNIYKDKQVLCKGLIDLIVVNHEYKTIRMFDVKFTSNSVTAFKSSFMKYRYYLQSAFYFDGLSSLTDYTVLDFSFIVLSAFNNEPPIVYNCTQNDLLAGKLGAESITGYNIKGYEQLINELCNYHIPTNDFRLPYEYRDGIVALDAFRGYVVNYEQ